MVCGSVCAVLAVTAIAGFTRSRAGEDDPGLLLRVTAETGNEVVNRVNATDLMRLDSFLQGNLYYTTSGDGQEPLHSHADRLRELLGLEEEQ